ncbi:hypothetical protein V5O48_009926 [Marasmius crinis-equi]|uniref:Uncharacterized protein n=1 Tax=Marasmius crinis-equi TaxID=585013 RepID=A0ABR3F9T8_9AGAR
MHWTDWSDDRRRSTRIFEWSLNGLYGVNMDGRVVLFYDDILGLSRFFEYLDEGVEEQEAEESYYMACSELEDDHLHQNQDKAGTEFHKPNALRAPRDTPVDAGPSFTSQNAPPGSFQAPVI